MRSCIDCLWYEESGRRARLYGFLGELISALGICSTIFTLNVTTIGTSKIEWNKWFFLRKGILTVTRMKNLEHSRGHFATLHFSTSKVLCVQGKGEPVKNSFENIESRIIIENDNTYPNKPRWEQRTQHSCGVESEEAHNTNVVGGSNIEGRLFDIWKNRRSKLIK